MVKLGDVATYINGYAFKPRDYSQSGLRIIRIQDLTGNVYQANRFDGILPDKYRIHDDDVLISWSASLGVYRWHGDDAYLNQHIFKVAFDKLDVDKDFFTYQASYRIKKAGRLAHGATMTHLTKKVFDGLPFWLPNQDVQRHVALVLNSVQKQIDLVERMLTKADELVQSRFVEMLGAVTDMVPLSHYVRGFVSGKSLVGNQESRNKVLKTSAVAGNAFDESQLKNLPVDYVPNPDHAVRKGDVIINRKNTIQLVGSAGYVWDDIDDVYLSDLLWKAQLNADVCHPIFLWQVFANESVHRRISNMATGANSSMANIAKKNVLAMPVPCVPIELQREFAAFVEQIEALKSTLDARLDRLTTLYDSLTQRYFAA